jgi:hypothetical protein
MLMDTSSAAAGISEVVRAAATVWAALRFDPMLARSETAAAIISGAAITYDISATPY